VALHHTLGNYQDSHSHHIGEMLVAGVGEGKEKQQGKVLVGWEKE